jgi:hypothetical protein
LDNPDLYRVLYAAESPAAACAEAFGMLSVWTDGMLTVPGPAATMALATLELEPDGSVLDLDDPAALSARGIRPSRVVTSDREISQSWSRSIFQERAWAGVRWWSYYDAGWGSLGLWNIERLRLVKVAGLKREHPALEEARHRLRRLWL